MVYPYSKKILKNGLTLFTYNMRGIKTVYAMLQIRVGGLYENGENCGISHFCEHLCFQGTKKYPNPLILAKRLQELGAENNATTSREKTEYWIRLPYKNWVEGLEYLQQIVFEPLLKPDDIEKEKEVVIQEYNDFWNNPDNRFNYEIWRRRFVPRTTCYTRPVFGTLKSISGFDRTKIQSLRKNFYFPENMYLILVGNIDEKGITEWLENNIQKDKSKSRIYEPKYKVKFSGKSLYLQKENRPQIKFHFSFPAEGFKDISIKERMSRGLFRTVFGRGWSSRLYQRVRESEKLVYDITAGLYTYRHFGEFYISGSCSVENIVKVAKAIKEEMHLIISKGIMDDELKLSKNMTNSMTYMSLDSPWGIADYFSEFLIDEEKIRLPEDWEREGRKITIEDINQVARELLNFNYMNINLMGDVPEKITKEIKDMFFG